MEQVKQMPLGVNLADKAEKKAKKHKSPNYSKGEELFNVITHIIGVPFGIVIMILGSMQAVSVGLTFGVLASIVYGACMIATYGVSAVYHFIKPSKAKRVMRVIDHCTVYLLIIGTYTGLLLTGILPYSATAAIVMLSIEWGVGALAITLTAIDMHKYAVFSMICYIVLGWGIVCMSGIVISAISFAGFMWLLGGGISYTVGSILYGIGKKHKYMHSVFHIFCILGSVAHFICFIGFCF